MSGAMFMQVERAPYSISTDPARLDLAMITDYLARSYWAEGIPLDVVERAVKGSLCFGVYVDDRQIGFARVVSDFATFAYVGDVFILDEFRGRGLSKRLMESIVAHPDLQGLRRWLLATKDAHSLYEQFEFASLKFPERWMERTAPDAY